MKNVSKLIFVFALIFWGVNTVWAQTSLRDDKAMKAVEVKNFVNSQNFVVEATHEDLRKGNVPLSYHKYDIAVSKDTLIASLPDPRKGAMKISSTSFAYNAMKEKNGNWDIVIKPKAGLTSEVKQIKMKVTPQGHASVRVLTATQRGPLEFDGYIKQESY